MLLSSSVCRSARHELQSSIREPSLENKWLKRFDDNRCMCSRSYSIEIAWVMRTWVMWVLISAQTSNVTKQNIFYLLLASCWLRWVLLAQFAMSVSASLRIRSDFVRDEWALEYYNIIKTIYYIILFYYKRVRHIADSFGFRPQRVSAGEGKCFFREFPRNGRCVVWNQVISWLPPLIALYDQRTIKDILPLYILCKRGNFVGICRWWKEFAFWF